MFHGFLFAILLQTAAATPRVAVVADPPSQAGRLIVSHIQAALADSACVLERADLTPVGQEAVLRETGRPLAPADLLVLVRVEATTMKAGGWLSFISDASDAVILLEVKAIDTRSGQIVRAWAGQKTASLAEIRLINFGEPKVSRVKLPVLVTIRPGTRLAQAIETLAAQATAELQRMIAAGIAEDR